MNYEDMTDFDINKAVCATKGVKIDDEQYEYLCDRDERVVLCRDELDMSIGVDYCNNPSDAWPIILEDKINLLWDTESTEWEAQAIVTTDMYFPSTCEHYYYDKNPLRAAMIVYLMMNEDK